MSAEKIQDRLVNELLFTPQSRFHRAHLSLADVIVGEKNQPATSGRTPGTKFNVPEFAPNTILEGSTLRPESQLLRVSSRLAIRIHNVFSLTWGIWIQKTRGVLLFVG
jgi:hypothetical protein